MAMPRASRHDKPRAPAVDLIREPLLAFRRCLLPGTQVVGIAGGKGVRGAEIFPAKVNGDSAPGGVGRADEGVGAGHVFFLEVFGVAAWVSKGIWTRVHQVERRTMVAILPIHFDAEADLVKVVCAVRPAPGFFGTI